MEKVNISNHEFAKRATYKDPALNHSYSVRWYEDNLGNVTQYSITTLTPLDDKRYRSNSTTWDWAKARSSNDPHICQIYKGLYPVDTISILSLNDIESICDIVCSRLDELNGIFEIVE